MTKINRLIALLTVSLAASLATASNVRASDPTIEGQVDGIELCPKFICGRAIFTGSFQGRVGGAPAFGTWLAAIDHEDLPDVEQVVRAGPGDWTLRVWVFQGWFPKRTTFAGTFGIGTLEGLPGNYFQVNVPMEVTSGGSGAMDLDLLLDENFIPQPVSGNLSQPQGP